jgi:hypothetical protein
MCGRFLIEEEIAHAKDAKGGKGNFEGIKALLRS